MSRRHVSLFVAAILVLGAVAVLLGTRDGTREVSATFPRTTSLYEGASVKVLGVKVGRVDSIKVAGTAVRVEMSYEDDVSLPADVHAVIVPPSIVGDRFVQLAPAYTGGSKLRDGAHLALDRTQVPLELEDTYAGLNKLSASLGPKRPGDSGAYARLISSAARNLEGNGALWNSTLTEFADAMSTLAASSGDFNATLKNLGTTTHMLAGKDEEIRSLIDTVAQVGTNLNNQGDDLTDAIDDLRKALTLLSPFVKANRGEIEHAVDRLTALTGQLAEHREELATELVLASLGLNNQMRTYVPDNWEFSQLDDVAPGARTGASANRSLLANDLDTTLGFALSAMCHSLPPEERTQLAAFCSALDAAGGDLGALAESIGGAAVADSGSEPDGSKAASSRTGATSLDELLAGGR